MTPHAGTLAPCPETGAAAAVGVQKVREQQSRRHPFHPEVLADLDHWLAAVESLPPDTLVSGRWPNKDIDSMWGSPDAVALRRRLDPRRQVDIIRSRVLEVAEVAASEVFLTAASVDVSPGVLGEQGKRGKKRLTVQHQQTGLRALFQWTEPNTIGSVVARSYTVTSIDPARTWSHEGSQAVEQWEGLGVTTRIYQRASLELPAMRWAALHLNDNSGPLRAKMHRIDPWRWQAPIWVEVFGDLVCGWCAERDWPTMTRADFTDHPNSTDRPNFTDQPGQPDNPAPTSQHQAEA